MRKIVLLMFLLFIPFVQAQENVLLAFKDLSTDENIAELVIATNINGDEASQYLGEDNLLKLDLSDGAYDIIIKGDDPFTPGKDYFKKEEILVETNLVDALYLHPVGTLRGMVKDRFDNVVSDAELQFECTNLIDTDFPEKTSTFGSFNVDYMPVGSCKIFAHYGDVVGIADVEIAQGEIKDIEIILVTSVYIPIKDNTIYFMILNTIIIILVVFLVMRRKPRKERGEVFVEKPEEKEPSSRTEDIKETLNAKEKKIVDYLLENKGESSQAQIRHHTKIPRTSLARCLISLEAKKVVKVEKLGKLVKVSLTDWFSGNG